MRSNPEVTIIITNYNYGKYVLSAFRSIYEQDYDGIINVIIVNDGSTDISLSVLESEFFCCSDHEHKSSKINRDFYKGRVDIFQKVYDDGDYGPMNVMVLDIDNSGASVARNVGINYALKRFRKTKVVGILDADDMYYPDKVRKLAAELVDYKEVAVAYSDYDIEKTYGGRNYTKTEYKKPFSTLQLHRECIISSGSLISVDSLKSVATGGIYYNPKLHGPGSEEFVGCTEDYDLWLRLSRRHIACHVPESLSLAREHGNNASHKMTQEIFNENAQIIKGG